MFGGSVLGLGGARVLAEPLNVTGPATALEPARRLGIERGTGLASRLDGRRSRHAERLPAGQHKGADIGNGCSPGRGRSLLAPAKAVVKSMEQSTRTGRYITFRDHSDNFYRYHYFAGLIEGLEVGDAVFDDQMIR